MTFQGKPCAFESPAEAIAGMIARLGCASRPLASQTCPLASARGRVLAQKVLADRDLPAFDSAAMDGYALRVGDLTRTQAAHPGSCEFTLPLAGEARIGHEPPALPNLPGGCAVIRISTGAPLPPGADAILKREDVREIEPPHAIGVRAHVAARIRMGDHIRYRGENARTHAELLPVGTPLTPSNIGTLAAVGCASPRVFTRLRVALITTGDEICRPAASPGTFQIRDSNAPALASLLSSSTWIELHSVNQVSDDAGNDSDLPRVLRDTFDHADAIVLTGGVSMGHRDPVRGALESLGAQVVFHGLPQRPGKPILGGIVWRAGEGHAGIPIFGLPGNPISALVTCARIVRPVLAACAGISRTRPVPRVAIANPDGKCLDLWWHRLVRLGDAGDAVLVDGRGSGDVVAGGNSDGFIEVPPGSTPPSALDAPRFAFFSWDP